MSYNLPFLIKLCDDPSPRVRAKVLAQLQEIPDLEAALQAGGLTLSASQREVLEPLLSPAGFDAEFFGPSRSASAPSESGPAGVDEAVRTVNDAEISADFSGIATPPGGFSVAGERPHWLEWLDYEDEWAQLEAALDSVARWLDFDSTGLSSADAVQLMSLWPDATPPSISQVLDDLARDFRAAHNSFDAAELALWLFAKAGGDEAPETPETPEATEAARSGAHDTPRSFAAARQGPALRGATAGDFWNPLNSHLVQVVRRGRGLPIALTSIFMLVGRRVDLEIHGCNFPGHFLAFTFESGGTVFFDPFDGGRELTELETAAIRRAAPEATAEPARAREIVARFLRNLAMAYEHLSFHNKARFMLQLLAELEAYSAHDQS